MSKTERPVSAIHTNLAAIFISMELSRSTWLITSILPGNGEKMSKHKVSAGNIIGLFDLFSKLREKSRKKTGND
jgi:transposase